MPGGQASSLLNSAWYMIARDGNLVLRIRSGMRLGEDAVGELRFDGPDSELMFDIRGDGRLVLVAGGGRTLEVRPGERTGCVDLGYDSHARIRLPHNELSLATDLRGAAAGDGGETSTVRIVRREDPAAECAADGRLIVLPEPKPAAAGVLGRAARRPRVIGSVVLGLAALIAAGFVLFETPIGEAVAPPGADPDATSAGAQAPARVAADGTAKPDDASDDPQQLPTPPAASAPGARRDPAGAPAIADANAAGTGVAAHAPPIEPVYVPPILRRAAPKPTPAAAPPTATPFASLEPTESGARAGAAAGAAPVDADGTAVGAEAATGEPAAAGVPSQGGTPDQAALRAAEIAAAIEQDLRAAASALERGQLMEPPAASAFTLYSRVLESDPDSAIARSGLQLVRERLLTRVRAALAADQADRAMSALADAAAAGADADIVSTLRAQAVYRQRLRDAKTGVAGILYPIVELTALSQDPPEYPRHAPAGAEGSVDIEMTVTESGAVRDVEVLGNPPMYFIRAARRAVATWQFAPVLLDGEPVPVRTSVKVTFRRAD